MFRKKEKRFEKTSVQHYQYGLIMVLVGHATEVHYLHTWAPQGVTLTPPLDENGEPVIEKVI